MCVISKEVQVLSRNIQSVTGQNRNYFAESSGLNPWTVTQARLKAALVAEEVIQVPLQDRWRVPYLHSLLSQRGEAYKLALEEDEKRLSELIDSLVKN